jgi:hypothetical protein
MPQANGRFLKRKPAVFAALRRGAASGIGAPAPGATTAGSRAMLAAVGFPVLTKARCRNMQTARGIGKDARGCDLLPQRP